ncbi:MAG: 2-(5''-triphosphoribosyl)-3'-dephosphocoenzyme-A synthase [Candidatus Celerinatantimonas neptuna]|nr:MAG: 2-(5''-triphosphoribosyl)-3'-dephosphocoenzyme-A synthase [Candidatus Celerinatantimonas neptuna]
MLILPNSTPLNAEPFAQRVAQLATQALLDEARLTPKPGLVDGRGCGAHDDLDLALMERSANSLRETFFQLALCSLQRYPDVSLRIDIGRIGRVGEQVMLDVTHGVNTHRGAIWALGLLVSAFAMHAGHVRDPNLLTQTAARLARIDDPMQPQRFSKGKKVCQRYRIPGAREQAQLGFPTVIDYGLNQLWSSRICGADEDSARLDALLAMMQVLTDTCVLSRGGIDALKTMQAGARAVLNAGGCGCSAGRIQLSKLDCTLLELYVSPGGSADLLSATLLLDWFKSEPVINPF